METERPKIFQMWGTFDSPWGYSTEECNISEWCVWGNSSI